jgi:medium-chain acyl-[acyl-carrier-protein] hydrolase
MGTKHTENFKVRTAEINHLKLIHPHALIQLMQEASMQHTISMKVSVWDLEKMKASWVLLKMDINFFRFPSLNEEVKVITYPSGLDGYFTFRDYFMYDQKGFLCATISSMWTLMNTESRKMIKIPDDFGSLVYQHENNLPRPSLRFETVTAEKDINELKVNYLHLDWNGHVNNVQLIRLLLESLDFDLLSKKALKTINLQFKAEAIIGHQIIFCNEKQDNNVWRHAIKEKDSQKDLLLAVTEWTDLI